MKRYLLLGTTVLISNLSMMAQSYDWGGSFGGEGEDVDGGGESDILPPMNSDSGTVKAVSLTQIRGNPTNDNSPSHSSDLIVTTSPAASPRSRRGGAGAGGGGDGEASGLFTDLRLTLNGRECGSAGGDGGAAAAFFEGLGNVVGTLVGGGGKSMVSANSGGGGGIGAWGGDDNTGGGGGAGAAGAGGGA